MFNLLWPTKFVYVGDIIITFPYLMLLLFFFMIEKKIKPKTQAEYYRGRFLDMAL